VHDEFGRLVNENYERIFGVIYRLIGDRQEAEDLTQDTFVNAYRARDAFRGDSKVSTWLYRIAVNLTKNRLEQLRRRSAEVSPADVGNEGDWEDSVEDGAEAPDRQVENTELGRVIVEAILRLRPDYREIVILREYEHLSYEEITQIVGCSLQAVKSRLVRGRSILRRQLARYLQE